MGLYDTILGHPFVYNEIRPRVVGGIDMGPVYRRLDVPADARVLDVGCGTGDALNYLSGYAAYLGVDTDENAIRFAQERFGRRPATRFEARLLDGSDVAALRPSHVVFAGLLHHLTDAQVGDLFALVKASPALVRIVTQDIIYLPDEKVNNLFASLDRGQFCRRQEHYESLARRAGLRIDEAVVIPASATARFVKYLVMVLSPEIG
ncbi:MAG: class I SAM-dependent methyltransferase [Myxococcales bacterium]|nr:MAG: class I SAM-dependent methyltransferase [Myxococcales bacterium]